LKSPFESTFIPVICLRVPEQSWLTHIHIFRFHSAVEFKAEDGLIKATHALRLLYKKRRGPSPLCLIAAFIVNLPTTVRCASSLFPFTSPRDAIWDYVCPFTRWCIPNCEQWSSS
jgi:hypothetical protein